MTKIVWLKNWSHSRKHVKRKLAEPTTVYVIILLITISYVGLVNVGKLSVSGLATGGPSAPITPAGKYTPPDVSDVDCGSPCELGDPWMGDIGVSDINGDCLPIKQYFEERHCCFDVDCYVGAACREGVCKSL